MNNQHPQVYQLAIYPTFINNNDIFIKRSIVQIINVNLINQLQCLNIIFLRYFIGYGKILNKQIFIYLFNIKSNIHQINQIYPIIAFNYSNRIIQYFQFIHINFSCQYQYYSKKMSEQEKKKKNPYEEVIKDDRVRLQNMYRYPARVIDALIHKQANKFGYNAPEVKFINKKNGKISQEGDYEVISEIPVCPCCQLQVNTIPIHFCDSVSPPQKINEQTQMFQFPIGATFFFSFVKICIYYLILRFIIFDAFNLWTAYLGHYCELNPQSCGNDYYSKFSGFNKTYPIDNKFSHLQDYLNIALNILTFFYFYFWRRTLYKYNSVVQTHTVSQEYFSILLEEIPIMICKKDDEVSDDKIQLNFNYATIIREQIETKIELWIEDIKSKYQNQSELHCDCFNRKDTLQDNFYTKVVKKGQYKYRPIIASINLCFDVSKFQKIKKIREQLMDTFIEQMQQVNQQQENDQLVHIPNQIKMLNERYLDLSVKYATNPTSSFNLAHFIGKAFVTFEYQHYRQYFLREYERNSNFLKIDDKKVTIEDPPEPKDVFWHNMQVNQKQRNQSRVLSYMLTFMILVFSFCVLVGIEDIQIRFGRKMGEGPESDFQNFSLQGKIGQLGDDIKGGLQNSVNNITGSIGQVLGVNITDFSNSLNQSIGKIAVRPPQIDKDDESDESHMNGHLAAQVDQQETEDNVATTADNEAAQDGQSKLEATDLTSKIDNKINEAKDKINSVKQNINNNVQTIVSKYGKYGDIDYLKQQSINYLFIVILPALTNFINLVLKISILQLTQYQKKRNKIKYMNSLIIKNVFARFFNTTLIYFVIYCLHHEIGPLTQQGLVLKIMSLVALSSIIHSVTQWMQPEIIWEKLKQFCCGGQEEQQYQQKLDEVENTFQIRLNKQLQDPIFAYSDQYIYYLTMLFLVSFYSKICPLAVGYLILIFIWQYWQDKYNLTNRCSCPDDYNYNLTKSLFVLFELSLLIFNIGNLLFDVQIGNSDLGKFKTVNIVLVVVSLFYMLFVLFVSESKQTILFRYLKKQEFYTKTFSQYLYKFKKIKNIYWKQNPATSFSKEPKSQYSKSIIDDVKKLKKQQQQANYDIAKQEQQDESVGDYQNFIKRKDMLKYLKIKKQNIILEKYTKTDIQYINKYDDDDDFEYDQYEMDYENSEDEDQAN